MATLVSAVAEVPYYPPKEDGAQFRFLEDTQSVGRGELPLGFPVRLDGALVWRGSDLTLKDGQGIMTLSDTDIEHVHNALTQFKSLKQKPSSIDTTTFPLPSELAARLDEASAECYQGRGFFIVRGIEPSKYTLQENIFIFAGLSAHVAPQRGFQDKDKTQVLCHVFNRVLLKDAKAERETPAFTEGPMSFHTDLGEILALYTVDLDDQETGGETLLSSVWQMYNELAATRPDILRTLADTWIWDTYDDYTKRPPFRMPLFACVEDSEGKERVVCHCSRYPLVGFGCFRRNEELPPLTAPQVEALNAVHFIAEKNKVVIESRKGDLLFLNNMAVMHARRPLREEGMGDGKDTPLSKRHKLKFFLRDQKRSWGCPRQEGWEKIWREVYGDNVEGGGRIEEWIMEVERTISRRWLING